MIPCDSLQNWREADDMFDEASAAKMKELGFLVPANIGPAWRQACSPARRDFDCLAKLSSRHLIPAHGSVLRDTAREDVLATVNKLYP